MSAALAEAVAGLERELATRQKQADLALPIERLSRRLRTLFRQQARAFLRRMDAAHTQLLVVEAARLREAEDIPDWEALFAAAAAETEPAFVAALTLWLQAVLEAGFASGTAPFGVSLSFDLANPRAAAYAGERAAALVTRINDVTRGQLRTLVTGAVTDGASYQSLAKQIRDHYAGMHTPQPQLHIRDRAELIAIQELGEAYEAGNYASGEALQRAGLEMSKQWLSVGDARVSQSICAPNEQQGWIPFRDAFQSGHMRPLGHVGCRCTMLTRQTPAGP